jgi:hypothetical protein
LGLQPKTEEIQKNIMPEEKEEEEDKEEEMNKSIITQDLSVDKLAHVHKELLDNETKLQNIAEKNFKVENATIKATMTKDEPRLATNYPIKTGLASKSKKFKKQNPLPYKKKKVVSKKYKEKEVVHNGEKWYRLK